MTLIEGITDDPKQHMALVLTDGTKVDLTLTYRPQQEAWFADLAYTSATGTVTTINGFRAVTHPNLLRQWQNTLPFGLMIVTADNMDPVNQTDFEDGTSALYLLQGADITSVEEAVFPGP